MANLAILGLALLIKLQIRYRASEPISVLSFICLLLYKIETEYHRKSSSADAKYLAIARLYTILVATSHLRSTPDSSEQALRVNYGSCQIVGAIPII